MVKGKRYTDAVVRFDQEHQHSAHEALELVKGFSGAKFDESIDVAIRLGVDPRKPEEMIRGTVALPSGTGKDVRIAVFAQGAAATAAPATTAPATNCSITAAVAANGGSGITDEGATTRARKGDSTGPSDPDHSAGNIQAADGNIQVPPARAATAACPRPKIRPRPKIV